MSHNSMTRQVTRRAIPLALAAFLAASALSAATESPAAPSDSTARTVHLRFRAMVGAEPFSCGKSYDSLGVTGARASASDFRFYVSGVRLIAADGSRVPLALEQDGLWQLDDLALLDFEDASGSCSNGNPDVNDQVVGSAPPGDYRGVEFTLGVPFERNHRELVAQPSPLTLTRMFWAWNSGYKFLRIDLKTAAGKNWMIHLGSTQCTPTGTPATIPTKCAAPNRAVVHIDRFDPDADVVVADLAALLRNANLDVNQEKTAAGCMSGPDDSDCTPVFSSLGLPHGGKTSLAETFFRVSPAAGHPALGAP